MQEIMSDLMTNRKTSLLTVYALCFYYKIPVTLVKDTLYYEFTPIGEGVSDECVLYYRHGKYGAYITETDVPIFDKATAFRLETIYKPLRGVSTYKMPELEEIFAKLVKPSLPGADFFKKYKKGEMYDAILQKCVW
jgi:hypothetical protein